MKDQLQDLVAFCPGKSPFYTKKEAGRAPQPVRKLLNRKSLVPLPGNEPQFLGCPAYILDTALTESEYRIY